MPLRIITRKTIRNRDSERFLKNPNEEFPISTQYLQGKYPYRVRGGVGFGEECGLSEVTEIEGFSVLENIEIIMIPMSEN